MGAAFSADWSPPSLTLFLHVASALGSTTALKPAGVGGSVASGVGGTLRSAHMVTSGVGAGGQALHAVEAGLDERSVELGFGDGLVGIGHAERAESAVA